MTPARSPIALAALAAGALTAVAQAQVVYVDLPDTPVVVSGNVLAVDVNGDGPGPRLLTTDFVSAFSLGSEYELVIAQYDHTLFPTSDNVEFTTLNGATLVTPDSHAQRLLAGAPVGPASPSYLGGNGWLEVDDNGQGPWAGTSGVAFVGFKFDTNLLYTSFRYGWARVRYDDASDTLVLLDVAYQATPDVPILAGEGLPAVPEPGQWALFAAGAAVLAAGLRRRAPG